MNYDLLFGLAALMALALAWLNGKPARRAQKQMMTAALQPPTLAAAVGPAAEPVVAQPERQPVFDATPAEFPEEMLAWDDGDLPVAPEPPPEFYDGLPVVGVAYNGAWIVETPARGGRPSGHIYIQQEARR
jgi:hypothetical protein